MEKTSDPTAWMADYFEKIADRMPHTGQLHFPHFLRKKDIYMIMKREMMEQERKVISIQHFFGIWDRVFKNVIIPEVINSAHRGYKLYVLIQMLSFLAA